jgi:crotonobetainyl-CoA:carnitine CoA-transferase CaiB-like acyl-CoA transferase
MQSWCEDKSVEEAVQSLESARIPCAQIYSPKDVLEDPHVIEAGFFNAHEYPGVPGEYPVMARLFLMSDCEVGSSRRAPLLGEHTREILLNAGLRDDEIENLKRERVIYFSDRAE